MPTEKRYRVVHQITEGNDPRPVVTHLFHGDTPEEAMAVYEAHRKTDAFLRACDSKGSFEGRVTCHSAAHLERVG